MDYTPTPEQIERGFRDEDSDVRKTWVLRPDYTPTPDQIYWGFYDKDPDVRKAWEERAKIEEEKARVKKMQEARAAEAEKMLSNGIEF